MEHNDLMATLLASDTYTPVAPVANIPDPDAQLAHFLNQPGVSPAEADFAREWAAGEKDRRLTLVREWMKERHASNEAQARDVDERIFAVNQSANDVNDRVRKHDYSSVRSVAAELKELRAELVVLERVIDTIQQREQMINALAADPVGTFTDFYKRFPALAKNLPNLWDALTERRDANTRPALRIPSA